MATIRFPRAAYVRRLETLYDDLGQWREVWGRAAENALDWQTQARFEDRAAAVAEAQRTIMLAVDVLFELPRLS